MKNNRLPRIIPPPPTFCHFLFLVSPPRQDEVESDAAKLISYDSSSNAEDIDIEK